MVRHGTNGNLEPFPSQSCRDRVEGTQVELEPWRIGPCEEPRLGTLPLPERALK